jgi:hypothetical protein
MLKASPLAIALSAVALCATLPAVADPPPAAPPQGALAPPPGAPPPGYGVPLSGYPAPSGYPPPSGYSAPPASTELPPAAPVRYERRSSGLMMGGIILTTVGGVGMISAGILAQTAVACTDCSLRSQDNKAIASLTMLIVGAICVGIGIPMIVSGGKRVPQNASKLVRRAPAATWLRAPSGSAFRWTF